MQARYLLPAFVLFLALPACKKKAVTQTVPAADTTKTYFSISTYVLHQVQFYREQPLTLNRFETVNGKRDSTMVNVYDMEWAPVFKAFIATDISAPKFLNKYKFDQFDDNMTGNTTLSYEAKDPDLYTKSLQITVDPTNNRVVSIYITASDDGKNHKLLYIPLNVIQIQEDEVSSGGTKRNYRLEYRFLQ